MSLPPEPCFTNLMFVAFPWLDVQIFKLVILLPLSSLKLILILPTLSSLKLIIILLTLARSKLTLLFHFSRLWAGHIYFTDFGQEINEKRSKPSLFDKKNSRIMHRIWHQSFSLIQSVEIKNWVSQLIDFKCSIYFFLYDIFLICATK